MLFRSVGEISGATKAEAENFHVAMEEGHGNEWNPEKLARALDGVQDYTRYGTKRGLVIKNVGKDAADNAKCLFVAVNRERGALANIEGAYVVKTEDVVSVAVSEQNGVDADQTDAEGLLAEVRSGINDNVLTATGN